jgi:hypothetical protein
MQVQHANRELLAPNGRPTSRGIKVTWSNIVISDSNVIGVPTLPKSPGESSHVLATPRRTDRSVPVPGRMVPRPADPKTVRFNDIGDFASAT